MANPLAAKSPEPLQDSSEEASISDNNLQAPSHNKFALKEPAYLHQDDEEKPSAAENALEVENRKQLAEYRNHLVTAKAKAQDDYDRTVLALSGAAIGISLTIVKDFLGSQAAQQP